MAFFEEDNGEVKKLKKQITSQDLRIGLLESEKTAAQRQVSELTNKLSTLSTSAVQDSSRATQAEAALSRLQSDFNRQNVEKSNLQQALAKAEERYNQELKGRKFEEQRRDLALDTQLRQEMEQKKKLEDKVKNLESRLSDKEEEARRREQTAQSGSRGNTGALAKMAALEDELALLKAENIRLRSPSTSAFASSSTSSAGSNDQTPQRGPARRGRASSVSGASSSSASTAPNASRAQVQDLQNLYDEARSDLTRLEARAAKAEKEALKASNEVLAKERQGEKIAADLQTQLRELQEDLKWKKDECDSLAKEVEACEKRLDAAERRAEDLEAAKSQIERQLQESKKGQGSAGASSQQELTRLRSQLSQASDRCEGLELELSSLREQVAGTALSHDESTSAPSSSNANGQQSETRILRELRRSLSQVTAERDTLKREVGDLEDEIERLQASQPTQDSGEGMPELTAELLKRQSTIEELSRQLESTRTQLQQSSKALLVAQEAAQSSPNDQDEGTSERVAQLTEEYAELDNFCNELQGSVAELERKVSGLDRERSDIESERELLRGELEKLKQNGANSSNGVAHESSPHQAAVDLEELRSELEDLKADLADKETAMEQADALAEEDTRQLRMKEAEVKHLTAEVSRLRHRAKEASLEIDVLRASANFEGSVDASLDQLRAQLDARDEQIQELQTTLKRREDELDLGKRQLKRVTAFMAGRGAAMAADADVSISTPVKRGSTYRSGVSLDVAATPIAGLFKSKHFFATPGGKQLQRSFEEDLLDQIELIRESIEQAEEQQRFVNAERSANVRALQAELGKKSTDVEHLSVKLSEAENQLSEAIAERKREADADQAALIAEKDLAIQQHQHRITQLETDLAQLQQELDHAQSTLSETEARLESTFASNEISKADLQSQLEAANARAADVADLMQQLLLKRQELMEIETQRRAVEQAEALLQGEEVLLGHLENGLGAERGSYQEWTSITGETQVSLADCRQWLQDASERALNVASLTSKATQDSEDSTKIVAKLHAKIVELEGRVLRREEQIGSHQLKLENLATQLSMAEEDYEELMEEKVDLENELATLQQKLDASLKEQAEVLKNVRAEAEEANEALKETAQRLQEELDKVASLEERNAEMSRVEATAEPEQEDHATLRLELAQQEARVAELQSEVAQRQISLDEARVTLAEREQTLAELQSNYDDVVAEAAILKANNASHMESTGESNELQSALAQMQQEKQDLEQQLTTLRLAQTDKRFEDENCIARLESQIVDVEARAEALREDKDAAVQDLQRSEERLDQARSEVEALKERLSQAEAEKDARVAELSGLKAQTSVEADAEVVRALEEQIAALTEQAASVEVAHGEATQRLEAELLQALDSAKKAQEARHELECASEELRLQTAEVVRLGAVISELEASKVALQEQHDTLVSRAAAAEDASREQQQALEANRVRLASLQEELADRSAAFAAAEKAIEERDEHIKSRNEDYWNLKEELAELQEQQERSRSTAATVDMLEERLQAAQSENDKLHEDIARAEKEVSMAKAELESAERETIMKSSEVADLQGEMKRRKAAQRFTEEELETLKTKLEQAERGLQESVGELKRVEAQLKGAQSEVSRLESELATKESAPAASSASEDLIEEVSYLKERIEQMEQELTAKADEIEEADTRILTGLKENKKLSSRMKTLQKQIDALQAAAAAAAAAPPAPAPAPVQAQPSVAIPEVVARTPSFAPRSNPAPVYASSTAALSPISSSFASSRKRSAPEETPLEQPPTSFTSVRAIYQPAHASSSPYKPSSRATPRKDEASDGARFTPARRSPVKGESFLQDRTNTGRTPVGAFVVPSAAGTVKPSGMDMLVPGSEKKLIAPLPAGAGKERRPLAQGSVGALGGGGAGGGSGLMAALAKRKLGTRA